MTRIRPESIHLPDRNRLSVLPLSPGIWFPTFMTNLAKGNLLPAGFGFCKSKRHHLKLESLLIEVFSCRQIYKSPMWLAFLNTLMVSFIGIILTVILGSILRCIVPIIKKLAGKPNCAARIYVELFPRHPGSYCNFFSGTHLFYEMLSQHQEQALSPNWMGIFLC